MKKHMRLIGVAMLLLALVFACKNKDKGDSDKDTAKMDTLRAAIEKADKLLEDHNMKNSPMVRFPELKERRDEVIKVLDDARKLLEEEKGDFEAATAEVKEAIEEINSIAEDRDMVKEDGKVMGKKVGAAKAGGRRAGMNSDEGDESASVSGSNTEKSSTTSTQTTTTDKKKAGGRLPKNK